MLCVNKFLFPYTESKCTWRIYFINYESDIYLTLWRFFFRDYVDIDRKVYTYLNNDTNDLFKKISPGAIQVLLNIIKN